MCTAVDYLPFPPSPAATHEAGVTYAQDVFTLLRSVVAMREVFKDAQYDAITDPLITKVAPKLVGILSASVSQLPDVAKVRSEHATIQAKLLTALAAPNKSQTGASQKQATPVAAKKAVQKAKPAVRRK